MNNKPITESCVWQCANCDSEHTTEETVDRLNSNETIQVVWGQRGDCEHGPNGQHACESRPWERDRDVDVDSDDDGAL